MSNDPETMLRNAGIDEIINNLKEKTNGNRTSYSMFESRWNAPYGKDEQRSTGKNGGDTQAESRTVGDEGYKTNETSEEDFT